MPADNFFFDGQRAYLTYPQCGTLTRERVREFFVGLGVRQFCIALELHKDGHPHIHAVVCWGTRRRFVGADCFDVDGRHPNIQKPRSLTKCLAYCRKEDGEPLDSDPPLVGPSARGDVYSEILAVAESPDDFLARVRGERPRDLVLNLERMQAFCRWQWPERPSTYSGRARGEFGRELPLMTEWVRDNLEVRAGGAPVPSLLVDISSHAYCLVSPRETHVTLPGGPISSRENCVVKISCPSRRASIHVQPIHGRLVEERSKTRHHGRHRYQVLPVEGSLRVSARIQCKWKVSSYQESHRREALYLLLQ